jgi:hypothetical protein
MRDKDSLLIESAYGSIYQNRLKNIVREWVRPLDSMITEAVSDFGAASRGVPNAEMQDYLKRVESGKKSKQDRYNYPYVHRGNLQKNEAPKAGTGEIETKDVPEAKLNPTGNVEGHEIDLEHFRDLITQRPKEIISQNSKMEKSSLESQSFYNTSLPALNGLIYDEENKEFAIVNTCPSAGVCKTYCYAKSGGYVQWKAVSLRQTRILNFLVNHPEDYKAQIIQELKAIEAKEGKKKKKLVLRWNDSGDMLSDKYFEIVMDVARATPNVQHYAYTKMVGKAKSYPDVPPNFIFNFSMGAVAPEEKKIQPASDKLSVVVPDALVKNFIAKNEEGKWVYTDVQGAKNAIKTKYSIDPKSILTIDELAKTPKGSQKQYNVIVLPGESDLSASRDDVHGTYLILH